MTNENIQHNKTNGEKLIHIKLEYKEGIQSKKDLLLSEMNLLKIVKCMKRYHLLREEELKLKLRLYRKLRELNLDMKRTQAILPELQIPRILKKVVHLKEIEEYAGEENYDRDLQKELE